MQTYRCRLCGHPLASFVNAVPGLALPYSHETAMRQLQAAKEQHADWCPGERKQRAKKPAVKKAHAEEVAAPKS